MRKVLHYFHAVVFAVLLVSGFLLHFTILRGPLSAYRLSLIRIHSLAGELFVALVVLYMLWLLLNNARWRNRPYYSWLTGITFIAMIVWSASGWILLNKVAWGPVVTTFSFEIHRWLAYLAVPAVVVHVWVIWSRSLSEKTSGTRRKFFGWLTQGVIGAWAASLGWRFWSRNQTQDIKGTENCDVFYPAPQPSEKSLPPIGGGRRGKFGEFSVVNFLPCLHHHTWRFTIDGLVDRSVTFRWEDFLRLPRKVQVSDFHCVEGWSVFDITYEGLKLTDLLAISGIRPEAKYVKFYSADGQYADALSLEQALHMPDVMIAMLMDGEPIPRVLGGPARLVVPQMYAYKAVKWVNRIELIDKPYLGYWEFHGFETDAWVGIY
jgi:hypothetical protein